MRSQIAPPSRDVPFFSIKVPPGSLISTAAGLPSPVVPLVLGQGTLAVDGTAE